jgi:regulator of replication initiation timing
MMFSRMTHVRELKAEIARLKEDNSNLRDENASIKARFSLAITVMEDMRALPGQGKMVLVDG